MNENTTNTSATINLADTLPALSSLMAKDWDDIFTKGQVNRLSWLSADWGFEVLSPADVKKASLVSGAVRKFVEADIKLAKTRNTITAVTASRADALGVLERAEKSGLSLSTDKLKEVNKVLEDTASRLASLRKTEDTCLKVVRAYKRVAGADDWRALWKAWEASLPALDLRMMAVYREDTLGVRTDIKDDALLEAFLKADRAFLLKAEKAEKDARHHALADLLGFWGGKKCAKLNNTEVAFIAEKMLSSVSVEFAVTGFDVIGNKKVTTSIGFTLAQNGARTYTHVLAMIIGCKCSGVRFTPQNVIKK